MSHYNFIKNYYLLSSSKSIASVYEIQKCRFCNKTSQETSFNQITHLLPELLGKNKIHTYDECDICNALFSDYESHFSNFIRPYITFLGIKGKKRIPKFQSRSNENIETTRTLMSYLNNLIKIECEDVRDFKIDENSKTMEVTFRKPAIVPIKVYKALLKIGLSLLPSDFHDLNRQSFDWLTNKNDDINFVKVGFLTSLGNYTFKEPEAHLFRTKELSANGGIFPEYVLILKFANQLLQIFLPFTTEIKEEMHINKRINISILPANIFFKEDLERVFKVRSYDFGIKESTTEDLVLNFAFDSIAPNVNN